MPEVSTSALVQGPLGVASLKQSYRLAARNWRSAFACLPTYTQWIVFIN